jgi:glycerol-3-phosphate dehydrogenase
MNRPSSLNRLNTGETFDLLIIGGGATGLGAALDAAARGYSVALVERGDYAGGTSSRSTKLVHGGVRYLKQGNIALVREALRERGRLARNAPHLVRDLSFVIPAYHAFDRAFYGVGLKVYDALSGKLSLGPSLVLDRAETLRLLPNVEPSGLRGGVLYHDGQFDDSRLAITLARTAEARGAVLLNHVEAVDFLSAGGKISGARVRDRLSGRELEVRARVVINATGIFVDELRAKEDPATSPLVTVSQGAHLVLPRRFLPGDTALMVPKTDDGRVLFIVPWHDRLVVGTTDAPRPAPEVEPRALAEESAFILEHARRYLAQDPAPADVLSVFAGLRPLVRGKAGSATAKLSREHALDVGPDGLLTVTGGKWTTYRAMAEQVVDLASRLGGLAARPCSTVGMALHGATEDAPPAAHPHLGVYGDEAAAVLAQGGAAARLHADLPYLESEVLWAARHESACTVEDVLARRTRALLLDARAAAACAPRVARLLAAELGRDAAWEAKQVADFLALAQGYFFTKN